MKFPTVKDLFFKIFENFKFNIVPNRKAKKKKKITDTSSAYRGMFDPVVSCSLGLPSLHLSQKRNFEIWGYLVGHVLFKVIWE